MKSVRRFAPRRQITAVDDVLSVAREIAAADPWSQLPGAERKLLQVYAALSTKHGGRVGQPGVSWAADGEIARSIGASVSTVRRARRALASPPGGHPALIEVRYVPAFHTLPDGASSLHGVNVVKLVSENVPRAVDAARGTATPDTTGGRMVTVEDKPPALQPRAIDSKVDDAIAASQEQIAGYFEQLYGPRLRRLELANSTLGSKLEAVTARLDALERIVGGGSRSGGGAGGGGVELASIVDESARIASDDAEDPQRGSLLHFGPHKTERLTTLAHPSRTLRKAA